MNNPLPLPPAKTSWLHLTLIVLAFIGFADASYLTVLHYLGRIPPCSLVSGCELVTTSRFATVGPVSLALLGAFYYFALIVATVYYWQSHRDGALRAISWLSGFGVLISAYLIYLQLWVIEAICIYCLASTAVTGLIFIASLVLWRRVAPR